MICLILGLHENTIISNNSINQNAVNECIYQIKCKLKILLLGNGIRNQLVGKTPDSCRSEPNTLDESSQGARQ